MKFIEVTNENALNFLLNLNHVVAISIDSIVLSDGGEVEFGDGEYDRLKSLLDNEWALVK